MQKLSKQLNLCKLNAVKVIEGVKRDVYVSLLCERGPQTGLPCV